jgi:hypothetical protein
VVRHAGFCCALWALRFYFRILARTSALPASLAPYLPPLALLLRSWYTVEAAIQEAFHGFLPLDDVWSRR